jgi:hypothetical protein
MLWILYILWENILTCYVDKTTSHRLMQMITCGKTSWICHSGIVTNKVQKVKE